MKSAFVSNLVNKLTLGHVKYGWYDCAYRSSASPVFVGGCSRSGTTLLYSRIKPHSTLYTALETGLCTGVRDIDHVRRRTGLSRDRLKSLLTQSRCWPEFTERVLTALMHESGRSRWGDKSPVNVTVIDRIFEYFPNARFVHVIRDGRDVVCSLRTHMRSFGRRPSANSSPNSWDLCVNKWNTWVRTGIAWRGDSRYYELKYESLVADPESSLRALFDWLEEPWEPSLLESANTTRVVTHPEVSGPIFTKSIGRWKTDLPSEARELFRGPAGQLLVDTGYANDQSWID